MSVDHTVETQKPLEMPELCEVEWPQGIALTDTERSTITHLRDFIFRQIWNFTVSLSDEFWDRTQPDCKNWLHKRVSIESNILLMLMQEMLMRDNLDEIDDYKLRKSMHLLMSTPEEIYVDQLFRAVVVI